MTPASASGARALREIALIGTVSAMLVMGCTLLRDDDRRGPELGIVDSVVLIEPDSAPIGRFAQIAVGKRGAIFVADLAAGRVLRFSPAGVLERVIGSLGSGPGELLSAGQIGLVDDDTVLVVPDPRSRTMSFFHASEGRFLARYSVPFSDAGQTWTQRGDTVVFGAQFSSRLLGRIVVPTGDASSHGELPAGATALGGTFFRYGRIEAAPVGAEWLVLVPAEHDLKLVDGHGGLKGRISIPATRRRGVPEDLAERHRSAGGARQFEYLGSMTAGLWRLSTGATVMIMLDVDSHGPSEPTNARYFVTLIAPDFKTACVDGLLPFASDTPLPTPYVVNDTIVALARRIERENLRTIVYRYSIDVDRCDWMPVREANQEPRT